MVEIRSILLFLDRRNHPLAVGDLCVPVRFQEPAPNDVLLDGHVLFGSSVWVSARTRAPPTQPPVNSPARRTTLPRLCVGAFLYVAIFFLSAFFLKRKRTYSKNFILLPRPLLGHPFSFLLLEVYPA